MSRGNKIVPVRLSKEQIRAIKIQVEKSIDSRFCGVYSVSSWIRKAIDEKLAHLDRSRRGVQRTDEDCPGKVAD